MQKKDEVTGRLLQQKLLPLYYHDSPDISRDIFHALYMGGIRIVEYTNRGANALDNFMLLKKIQPEFQGMLLGIGTIKSAIDAKTFIDAGADFVVCPTVNAEVASVVHNAGLLWIPGCLSPSEIALAESSGATIVKIFPGNLLGPSYVESIKELFPNIKFLPTGGVEADKKNLRKWFRAGVCAVGMGSRLISKKMVESGDYKGIKKAAASALKLVSHKNVSGN
ncbi:MAG TPA: hypothetical protein VM012_05525 [Flavitalea sp.]|nr:hypothetical protein [Flavitalea sp.]